MLLRPASLVLLAAAVPLPVAAGAVELAPHRASYDLSLEGESDSVAGADGRIALEISEKNCEAYTLDYRFVARFQQEQELVVTDQRTKSTETISGDRFDFETKTFVDSAPEGTVSGSATTANDTTTINFVQPTTKTIDIPHARFPMQHTVDLIEKARAGERIVESRIFDGDDGAEKRLTSTAIIAPIAAETPKVAAETPEKPAETGGNEVDPKSQLAGVNAWRVSESFYNSDSDPDGMPIFESAYTLYENGVSDDLVLAFDGYTLTGGLASLDLLPAAECR